MAHDFSSIARFGLDSLMGDLMPMEDGQFVRLADVEAILRAAPITQTEDLAGAVWDGPNTASQVDPCMGLPSKR
jgi:hypothetical protein